MKKDRATTGNWKTSPALCRVWLYRCIVFLMGVSLLLNGCVAGTGNVGNTATVESAAAQKDKAVSGNVTVPEDAVVSENVVPGENTAVLETVADKIPPYCGEPYCELDLKPEFSDAQYESTSYISLSELDRLGRCGVAQMKITYEALPTEERGKIGHVKPSGWHTVKYPEVIADLYLYNRCHLLAYSLSGLNDEERNLITGTRYLNVEGMLPFEGQILAYVRNTKDAVLYRVTPIYEGDNLVCDGVLMEAASCDRGKLEFSVYCYNVQPGVIIDYATGDSCLGDIGTQQDKGTGEVETGEPEAAGNDQKDYVVNTNTGKYHEPSCPSVEEMKPSNRMDYHGTAEELREQGYEPCKKCRPE